MSRSRKRTPISPNACASSEKGDKVRANTVCQSCPGCLSYACWILPHRAAFIAIHTLTPRRSAILVYSIPNLRRCTTFSDIFL